MPEGPEVCLTAEILNEELKNYKLQSIDIIDDSFKKVPKHIKKFNNSLPLELIKVDSKGKLLFMKFEDMHYMTFSFGLEGKFGFSEFKYCKMLFRFKNANSVKKLYWHDKFSYGNITIYFNKESITKKLKTLGMDLLKTPFLDLWNLIKKMKNKKKIILEILMDQKKLGSGIGNYLSCEILYNAKIAPTRKISSLDHEDSIKLTKSIKLVMKQSYYDNNNKYMELLREPYLKELKRQNYHPDIIDFPKFAFLVYRQDYDPKGNKVKKDKLVNNRTCYWVPDIQK